nr:DUF4383 domain-containing protein [Microbacterium halimionae]
MMAILAGAIYIVAGLMGFTATGHIGFAAPQGGVVLGIFDVNPLQNIVNLIAGAVLLLAGLVSVLAAKVTNFIAGAVYLGVGIWGFFVDGTPANVLATNTPGHLVHIVTALFLIAIALSADKRVRALRDPA